MRTFEDVARAILSDAVTSMYVHTYSKDEDRAYGSSVRVHTNLRNVAHMLGLDDRREDFRKATETMWTVVRERVATLPDRGWLTGDEKERDAARWAIACEALRQATVKLKGLNLGAAVVRGAA